MASRGRGCGMVLGLLFLLFWSSICLCFDGFLAWSMYRQTIALGYARARGIIRQSRVSIQAVEEGGVTYGVDVQFDYEVGGQRYTGTRYRYGGFNASDRHAHEVVAALPVGTQVEVYYNPEAPGNSCLRPGLDGADLLVLMFMTPFNAVMILGWGCVRFTRPATHQPADGVVIRGDDFETRVRVTGIPPAVAGLLTAAGLAMGLTVVVALSGHGFHPPLHLMVWVWCLVLLAAGGRAWRTAQRRASGRGDLVIQNMEKQVILPALFGRKQPLTVRFADIDSVDVKERRRRHSDVSRYAATLQVACDDGPVRRETLAEWQEPAPAEDFARWLRQRLGLSEGRDSA